MSADWVYDKLSELVEPGYTVFDVGAHVGKYTVRFKNLTGPSGMVYAFELQPWNADILVAKFATDINVIINNTAVSDIDGQIDYYTGADSYTGNIIGHSTSFKPNLCAGKTKSLRLDTYYPEGNIDLMKIDVEGAEFRVLKGCKGIINNIKNMLVECHFDEDWPELRELIVGTYGFTATNLLTDDLLRPHSERPYQCLCRRHSI